MGDEEETVWASLPRCDAADFYANTHISCKSWIQSEPLLLVAAGIA